MQVKAMAGELLNVMIGVVVWVCGGILFWLAEKTTVAVVFWLVDGKS